MKVTDASGGRDALSGTDQPAHEVAPATRTALGFSTEDHADGASPAAGAGRPAVAPTASTGRTGSVARVGAIRAPNDVRHEKPLPRLDGHAVRIDLPQTLHARLSALGLRARQATAADRARIKAFIGGVRQELGLDPEPLEGKRGIDSDLSNFTQHYPPGRSAFLLLETSSGKLVGTGAFTRAHGTVAELRKMYLAPDLRGVGLGASLAEGLIELARQWGYRRVELETYACMKAAHSLYGRLGFVVSPQPSLDPACVRMELELASNKALHPLPSRTDKAHFFARVAEAIESRRARFHEILTRVDTAAGADYEIKQALDTLHGTERLELYNLQNTQRLENVAVYGSTNIPLYTLVLHGIVPMTISSNVWFRTPAASRDVYRELYAELAAALPDYPLDRLHLLTSASDVQYDNFRKTCVLGMNRNGTRLDRAPSEVVLFTGNPRTGRQILEANRDALAKVAGPRESYRQVFLGFGAGMNPMVVTGEAAKNVEPAIAAALKSIEINCGQDCIAPNFYLLHASAYGEFSAKLRERVRAMQPGQASDPSAAYSPLTFTESVDKLAAYRARYEDALLNPEATIDARTKLVAPHLFAFPFERFASLDLQEHYGPFITMIIYRNEAELQAIAKDPRVQRKVMYASVFGGVHAGPETTQAVSIFQQQRHGVSVNTSVYADESGNMPFGGVGADANVVARVVKPVGGDAVVTLGHRPILFSEEARREFPLASDEVLPPAQPPGVYAARLEKLLGDIDTVPARGSVLYGWERLREPQTVNRPTGLAAMRAVIASEGLYQVVLGSAPQSPEALRELEAYYGTKLVFAEDLPVGTVSRGKGVVLHPTMPVEGPERLNRYRGTVNPHLGRGHLVAKLDGNKLAEYDFAEAVMPGSMAKTETFADLAAMGVIGREFFEQRDQVLASVAELLAMSGPMSSEHRAKLHREVAGLAESYFGCIRSHFPEGAFIKNFEEFATADLGIQITSFGSNPERLADQYVRRFEVARLAAEGRQTYGDPAFQARMLSEDYETGTKFLNALVHAPEPLLAQSRVIIAKTDMGVNREYRVSFLDGEPVFGKLRFSTEYMPEEVEEAKAKIRELFAKAPPELRHLSGGADIARCTDGRWVIIEFNFGSSDGTLMPRIFPIDANEYVSALQGAPTTLIARLEDVYRGGPLAERSYLESLKHEKELWWKESLADLSVAEVARWLRNRHLRDFAAAPSPHAYTELLAQLEALFAGLNQPGNDDLENLLKGARYYMQRVLLEKDLPVPGAAAAAAPAPANQLEPAADSPRARLAQSVRTGDAAAAAVVLEEMLEESGTWRRTPVARRERLAAAAGLLVGLAGDEREVILRALRQTWTPDELGQRIAALVFRASIRAHVDTLDPTIPGPGAWPRHIYVDAHGRGWPVVSTERRADEEMVLLSDGRALAAKASEVARLDHVSPERVTWTPPGGGEAREATCLSRASEHVLLWDTYAQEYAVARSLELAAPLRRETAESVASSAELERRFQRKLASAPAALRRDIELELALEPPNAKRSRQVHRGARSPEERLMAMKVYIARGDLESVRLYKALLTLACGSKPAPAEVLALSAARGMASSPRDRAHLDRDPLAALEALISGATSARPNREAPSSAVPPRNPNPPTPDTRP